MECTVSDRLGRILVLFFTRFAFSFPSRCCCCCCYGCIVAEFLVPWFKITVAVKVRVVVFPEAFSFAIAAASFWGKELQISSRLPTVFNVLVCCQFIASCHEEELSTLLKTWNLFCFRAAYCCIDFCFKNKINCHFCCFFQCRSRVGFVALFEARFANVAVFSCGGILGSCNILGQLFLSISRTSYLMQLKVEVHSIFEARSDFNLVFALLFSSLSYFVFGS